MAWRGRLDRLWLTDADLPHLRVILILAAVGAWVLPLYAAMRDLADNATRLPGPTGEAFRLGFRLRDEHCSCAGTCPGP